MENIEVEPLNNKAKQLMVMLHGVGSDGYDLINLVPYMQEALPDCHFFSPNAIEQYDMANFGRQWFSLQDRNPAIITKLLANNAPLVMDIIKKKQISLGINNDNTIIFGFSQGTMMGIYLTLIQKNPFASMIGFSGKLLPPVNLSNIKTPLCLIHGEQDEVVPASESIKAAQYCKENNISHELLIIPNITHSIDSKGLEFALNFLGKIL